jgi:hypothetical protein
VEVSPHIAGSSIEPVSSSPAASSIETGPNWFR